MSFDNKNSFEAIDGFQVKDASGFYSGEGSPVGFGESVKLGSIYINSINGDKWHKTGSLATEWTLEVLTNDNSIGGVAASYVFTTGNTFGGGNANGE